MKRKYEAIVVLNPQGSDDAVDKIISQIGRDIEAEGARLEQIDQLGRRKFSYAPRHVEEGFYVNYHFSSEPELVDKVRGKLKLNPAVYMQYYQKAGE